MRIRFLILPLLMAFSASGMRASAQVSVYHDKASFLANVGTTVKESFEELPASPRSSDPIHTAAFSVTPDPGLIGILDGPAGAFGAFATDGNKFLFSYREGLPAGTLRFDLTNPTNAFGFFISDDAEIDGLVSLHTDTGETLSDITVLQAPPVLANGNLAFFGFTQQTPFSQVFLTSTGIDDSYGLDEIYVGTVPEPGTLLLGLAVAFPGIGLLLRRRSRK